MVEKLDKDMIEAMKSKDKDRLVVIRMVKAALKQEQIDHKKEINDDLEKSIIICIKNLLTQSLVDSGSDEMLCFGYMVKAKKMENMDG